MQRRVLILYGSQTGQAKAISEQIYEQCLVELNAAENNLAVVNYSLDLTDKRFSIECERLVVFVVSTAGEGEPPDNAKKFWRRISKPTLSENFLTDLHYALIGLGDSNYDRFANFSRDLDRRLQELGAKHFCETGFGDEAVGIEVGVEPWVYGLIPHILQHLGLFEVRRIPKVAVKTVAKKMNNEKSLFNSTPPLSELSELSLPLVTKKLQQIVVQKCDEDHISDEFFFPKLPVMSSGIFDVRLISLQRLTKTMDSNATVDIKSVFEATVESRAENFPDFVAGDSFGFICGNRDEEVTLVMKLLGCEKDADELFTITCEGISHLPPRCKLRDYFKYYCELRSVLLKSCIRCLADFCEDEDQKRRMLELSSREGGDDYVTFIRNKSLNIIDLLQMFDSCKPSLEAFFANIPCFVPRYYSVVNAQREDNKGLFRFAFSVAEIEPFFKRKETQLKGVFTGLLESLFTETDEINSVGHFKSPFSSFKVFKRKNPYFKLPKSPTAPLILIGPGTGVAPFIAFLEERQRMKDSGVPIGDCWLFFGCRHSAFDFIYERELHNFRNSNILTNLFVCFSREDCYPPKYVQDLIEENSQIISKLLKNNETTVFVCGDLKKLSVNVSNAFVNVVEQEDNLIREDAVQYIRNLQTAKRYLQDVWV